MVESVGENSTSEQSFRRAHVIVVGNEKGGSGKTTTTMHLIVALLRLGFSVGSMDLDSRQRSLTRYIENRRQTIAHEGVPLPTPQHYVIQKSPFDSAEEQRVDEKERFAKGLAKIYGSCDFVVIDTPGNDTFLSRLAHSFASTVITPINDSFVDLDVLAAVDGTTLTIIKPSIYSEMVWEQKLSRAKRDGGSIDWIVMRNRLSNLDARNKRFMAKVTEELARRIGFRVAPGFSERVIFREMFLQGLTVLDVLEDEGKKSESKGGNLSISHVAARQEVRNLLSVLKIPEIDRRIEKLRNGDIVIETPVETAPLAEDGPAFGIAREQQLPKEALVAAKAELARATVMHAAKAPALDSLGPQMPLEAKEDATYPVRPTPSFNSPQPEMRAPLIAEPTLPGDAKNDAKPLPSPALTGLTPVAPKISAGPAVPATPPAAEGMRALPPISGAAAPANGHVAMPSVASSSSPAQPAMNEAVPAKEEAKPSVAPAHAASSGMTALGTMPSAAMPGNAVSSASGPGAATPSTALPASVARSTTPAASTATAGQWPTEANTPAESARPAMPAAATTAATPPASNAAVSPWPTGAKTPPESAAPAIPAAASAQSPAAGTWPTTANAASGSAPATIRPFGTMPPQATVNPAIPAVAANGLRPTTPATVLRPAMPAPAMVGAAIPAASRPPMPALAPSTAGSPTDEKKPEPQRAVTDLNSTAAARATASA